MFIHILVMILILSTVFVIKKCGVVLVFHAFFAILNIVAVIIVIVVITIIP